MVRVVDILKWGLGLLFPRYVRAYVFCANIRLSTYLIYVCVFCYCRDGKNMCLSSSCG